MSRVGCQIVDRLDILNQPPLSNNATFAALCDLVKTCGAWTPITSASLPKAGTRDGQVRSVYLFLDTKT